MKHHRRQARRLAVLLCMTFSLRQFIAFRNVYNEDNSNPSRVFYFDPSIASSYRQVAPMSEHGILPEYVDFTSSQPWEHERCQYPVEWQRKFYPTCNTVHELEHMGKLAGTGYWRQGWLVDDLSVLKRGELSSFSLDIYL